MIGGCVCGGVRVEVARAPEFINICNCRLCRSSGGAFGYFHPDEVRVEGETRPFERDDIGEVWLTTHFCPRCGATTHWSPTGRTPRDRMGVNMRLFPQDVLEGIEARFQDGRAVMGEEDDFVVTAIGHIGDGTAF